MRDSSHTLISSLKQALNIWRRRQGWSRESVVGTLLTFYEQQGGHLVTGMRFEPETTDIYDRSKVNADRVYRWLDDDSKESNLLCANMVPYFIGALPMDLRLEVAQHALALSGLTVRIAADDSSGSVIQSVQAMAKEGGEAIAALAGINDQSTPEQIRQALRELTEAEAEIKHGLNLLEGRLAEQV